MHRVVARLDLLLPIPAVSDQRPLLRRAVVEAGDIGPLGMKGGVGGLEVVAEEDRRRVRGVGLEHRRGFGRSG